MTYDILTNEEKLQLQQIGAFHTDSIFAVARLADKKIKLFPNLTAKFIFGAIAFETQKSASSIAHWYYTYRNYGEDGIARYAGLSYSHLSWAMGFNDWKDILDTAVDENLSVDAMKAKFINAKGNPGLIVKIMEDIEKLIGKLRHLECEEKDFYIAQLFDMRTAIDEINAKVAQKE